MKSDLACSQYLLRLAAQVREAQRAYREDYPDWPESADDPLFAEWITEKMLLRAPVTLPKVKGVYLLSRNP